MPVRGVDGTELGVVQDIYRVAENEVYIVGGGAYGTFDVPAVRAFIRIFAPRRGEIVVDAEALDLQPPKERPSRRRSAACAAADVAETQGPASRRRGAELRPRRLPSPAGRRRPPRDAVRRAERPTDPTPTPTP